MAPGWWQPSRAHLPSARALLRVRMTRALSGVSLRWPRQPPTPPPQRLPLSTGWQGLLPMQGECGALFLRVLEQARGRQAFSEKGRVTNILASGFVVRELPAPDGNEQVSVSVSPKIYIYRC